MNMRTRIQSVLQIAALIVVLLVGIGLDQSWAQEPLESQVRQLEEDLANLKYAQAELVEQFGKKHPKVEVVRQRMDVLQLEREQVLRQLMLTNEQARLHQLQVEKLAVGQELSAAKGKYGAKHPNILNLERQRERINNAYQGLKNKQSNGDAQLLAMESRRAMQVLEAEYASAQMMQQELSQRFGPKHPQSVQVANQLKDIALAIREQKDKSGHSTDQAYSRIASLAKQLKQEVSSLEPLKSNEKPLAHAMSELQKALVILKEVQELSRISTEVASRDEAQAMEMKQAVMLDRLKEYENLIAEREHQMHAMQKEIELVAHAATATAKEKAMLAMTAARKDSELKMASELEARTAQLMALERRLELEMSKSNENHASSNGEAGVSKRLDRVEQQMDEIAAMLKKLVGSNAGDQKKD